MLNDFEKEQLTVGENHEAQPLSDTALDQVAGGKDAKYNHFWARAKKGWCQWCGKPQNSLHRLVNGVNSTKVIFCDECRADYDNLISENKR